MGPYGVGEMMGSRIQTWVLPMTLCTVDTSGVLDFCLESQQSCSLQSDFIVLFKCKYRNQVSITIGEGKRRMNRYSPTATIAYIILMIVLRTGLLVCFCLPRDLQLLGQYVAGSRASALIG